MDVLGGPSVQVGKIPQLRRKLSPPHGLPIFSFAFIENLIHDILICTLHMLDVR